MNQPKAADVVLLKKDVNTKFCVYYRQLNENTVKDKSHDYLARAQLFILDLRSGYWQVELELNDKEETAIWLF